MPNSPDRSPDQPPEPDETAPFWPFNRDPQDPWAEAAESDGAADDADGAAEGGDDATRVQGPAGGASDETGVQRPAGDQTSAQGPVDAPRWTARANVPSPGGPGLRPPAPQEWVEEDPYHGRSWFTPVIVGMVALVLVAALSIGIWLIYRATANGDNAPVGEVPAPTVASSSSAVPSPATPASSEAAPSSEAPSSSAPAPGPVVIPPLRGDTLAEATVKLQVLGLNVDVQRKADGSLPPGEVLSSKPGEGETVAPGDTVTLVVATVPSPAPSNSAPSPSGSGTP